MLSLFSHVGLCVTLWTVATQVPLSMGFSRQEYWSKASLVAQMLKNLPAIAGDPGSIPASGRSPGRGHGNPLQYSCLENSLDRGAWPAMVNRVAKSWKRLSTVHVYN